MLVFFRRYWADAKAGGKPFFTGILIALTHPLEGLKIILAVLGYFWRRTPFLLKILFWLLSIAFWILLIHYIHDEIITKISKFMYDNVFRNYVENYINNISKIKNIENLSNNLSESILAILIALSFIIYILCLIINFLYHRAKYIFGIFIALLSSLIFVRYSETFYRIIFNNEYASDIFDSLENFVTSENGNDWLEAEALSNILRNHWLLFIGIFVIFLAIWGRFTAQKQLNFTNKQLELTRQTNNSERFVKALEMLSGNNGKLCVIGGIHALRDLAREYPETEHIRCMNSLCIWLSGKRFIGFSKNEKIDKSIDISTYLADAIFVNESEKLAIEAIGQNWTKEQKHQAQIHKKMNSIINWPILGHMNFYDSYFFNHDFQGFYLADTNFENAGLMMVNFYDANLQNTNFKGADITGANMMFSKNLKEEQILSAVWGHSKFGKKRPKLPNNLLKSSKIQKWLDKPHILKWKDELENNTKKNAEEHASKKKSTAKNLTKKVIKKHSAKKVVKNNLKKNTTR